MKTQIQIQTLPPIESTSLIITLANSTQTQLNFGPNPTQIHQNGPKIQVQTH